MTFGLRPLLALALLGTGVARAEVINYQGRLTVGSAPYSGVGLFRFEILDDQGTVAWSSGELSLNVQDGRYAVRLGESAGVPPIGPLPAQAHLRVWFHREGLAWGVAGSDIPIPQRAAPVAAAPAAPGTDAAILAELQAIRTLLAGSAQCGGSAPAPGPAPAPPPISMPMPAAPSLGRSDASLVLVEFLDYQCPYCVKYHSEIYPQIKSAYVDTGKLRVSSVQLPLPFHSFADAAARAAVCADGQGRFWEMRDRLFSAGGNLPADILRKTAQDSGLDLDAFLACSGLEATSASIKKGIADAKTAGIEATPTFVLGRVSGGKITGVKIVGALPFATFAAEINKQLAAAN